MKKNSRFALFLAIALSLVVGQSVTAQEGHKIEIELNNYEDSTIIMGYYYGDKTLILDTLTSLDPGIFLLEGDEPLHSGVYLMLTAPQEEYVQFMVNPQDQHFKLITDSRELGKVRVEGSDDNRIFYEYLEFLRIKREEVAQVNSMYPENSQNSGQNPAKQKALQGMDKEVKAYQKEIIKNHPDLITSLLLKGNMLPDIPEFTGSIEEKKIHDFNYYKSHYFDHIEFDNPASLYTPFFFQKIDDYMNKMTVQVPDSISKALDFVLDKISSNEEAYRFFLSHFLNTYAQSKVVGFDAVYVHLAENYYAKAKAPWVDEENLRKIVNNAYRLKPTLIGNQAPGFTVFEENGNPVNLYNVVSEYTLLFFWAPDCGHCAKAIPKLKEFYANYKDKGVKVISICNKTGEQYDTCWKGVKDKDIQEFVNVGDQTQKSRILSKYYVKNTPKIFILDRDKKIIMKNIGAEQLEEVMGELIRMDEKKSNTTEVMHK